MLEIAEGDIGGARVRRTFTSNGRHLKMGEQLSSTEVLAIRLPNRKALIESHFIEVYPKAPSTAGEKFVVGIGGDKFNVIEGRVLNETPLSKKEADKLAHA